MSKDEKREDQVPEKRRRREEPEPHHAANLPHADSLPVADRVARNEDQE